MILDRTNAPLASAGFWRRVLLGACCIVLCSPFNGQAAGQLIPVKTARFAEGEQFGFLPSVNVAMAGVSIAMPDTLGDAFVNPAKAARLARGMWFGSPTVYSVSNKAGGAITLPVGALLKRGSTFAGMALAIQEISPARGNGDNFGPRGPDILTSTNPGFSPGVPIVESRTNRYAYATLGHGFKRARVSLAASAMWSGLNAMDGVDLLYPGSERIRQSGNAMDLRLGALKEWGETRSLEAVVVHSRYAMSHDIDFLEFFWDPARRQPMSRTWNELNEDRTQTYGAHFGYSQRLSDSTWRVGAIVTGNRTWHPEMSNYSMMNIARNPGNSSAFNAGIGASKTRGSTTFAADAIYEPVWSHAWETGRTNDNRFRFDNALLRAGVSHSYGLDTPGTSLRMQFGVQLRAVGYELDQRDSTSVMQRSHGGWNEWTQSWGASLHLSNFEIQYKARLQSGLGRPAVPSPSFVGFGFLTTNTTLVPPSGAPSLVPVRIAAQQFSISIPIR